VKEEAGRERFSRNDRRNVSDEFRLDQLAALISLGADRHGGEKNESDEKSEQ
jgi:hypothetical protein